MKKLKQTKAEQIKKKLQYYLKEYNLKISITSHQTNIKTVTESNCLRLYKNNARAMLAPTSNPKLINLTPPLILNYGALCGHVNEINYSLNSAT